MSRRKALLAGKSSYHPKVTEWEVKESTLEKDFIMAVCPDIPYTERVIHSFKCVNRSFAKTKGRIFITQNYLIFVSLDKNIVNSFSLGKIIGIERLRSHGVAPTRLSIRTDDDYSILFSHLIHREDFASLLSYFSKHTPTYIELPKKNEVFSQSCSKIEEKKSEIPEGGEGLREHSEPILDGRWKLFYEEEKRVKEKYEKVDLKTAEKVSQISDDILNIASNTRAVIQEQAKILWPVLKEILMKF